MRPVLALDPGRDKVGVALLHADGTPWRRGVLRAPCFEEDLRGFLGPNGAGPGLEAIVVGDGTASAHYQEKLRTMFGGEVQLEVVDERRSTLEARERFYRDHPPSWPLSWLPRGLWPEPDVPLDGYAAEVLALRWLRGRAQEAGSGGA